MRRTGPARTPPATSAAIPGGRLPQIPSAWGRAGTPSGLVRGLAHGEVDDGHRPDPGCLPRPARAHPARRTGPPVRRRPIGLSSVPALPATKQTVSPGRLEPHLPVCRHCAAPPEQGRHHGDRAVMHVPILRAGCVRASVLGGSQAPPGRSYADLPHLWTTLSTAMSPLTSTATPTDYATTTPAPTPCAAPPTAPADH